MDRRKVRTLYANEIECRVGATSLKGFSLLLYKDARVDMKLLDEEFGENNWQRTHEVINGNLFCNIEIWDVDKKCWVKKQDVGTESNTEAEKAQASDSFKRAGFNWGIGRELYTAPFIWIGANEEYTLVEKVNGKDKLKVKNNVKFKVSKIGYNDQKEIIQLTIKDHNNRVAYSFGNQTEQKANDENDLLNKAIGEAQKQQVRDLGATKVKEHLKNYNKSKISDLTFGQAHEILKKESKEKEEVF